MARTLLIGLDGATFGILDPLMQSGIMPCLSDLVSRGVRTELRSTANPLTAQAWPSLMTGCNPGQHGIFDFVRFHERPTGGYFTVATTNDLRCETVWMIASRQDRSVTALNFFATYPPPPVRGHVISGFVPSRYLRRAVHPPALYDRLQTLPGFDRKELAMDLELEKKCIQGLPDEDYEDWIQLHMRREAQWFAIAHHLMTHEPSDLTAIVFDGVDKLQHLCWRFVDPSLSPSEPTAWEARVRDLCLEYFRRLDRYIAGIVSNAGTDAHVYVASDHGFGASTEIFYVNVWLHQHGYLTWKDDAARDRSGRLTADRMKSHAMLIDWERTTAYALTPSSNGISIRVEGRGQKGGIRASDYPEFRRKLIESLLDFRDPVSGGAVVTSVRTREEVFPGGQMALAPDLLLTLRDGGFVSILNADTFVRPRAKPVGTHRPNGVFVACGPGIRAGVHVPQLSIVDVTPALLYSLGLPIPAHLDGRLPVSVYEPSWLRAHPIEMGGGTRLAEPIPTTSASDVLEEDGELWRRLEVLGYIE